LHSALHSITPIIITMTPSPTPINLVSVNTAPERAAKVIGAVINNVKDKYNIVHAGNTTTIEGVKPLLESIKPAPGILVSRCWL
jgi:hypothetical protein